MGDLLKVASEGLEFLDENKKKFIGDLRNRSLVSLTLAQQQYLQSCYDEVVGKKYGLEEMSTDKEYAARRAILRARRLRAK